MTDATAYAALDDRLLVVSGRGHDPAATERLVGHDFECIAASPDCPDRAFAGTVESGIQRTTDGGDTWERVSTIDDRVTSLAVSPHDPDVVWAGTEPSAVYRSTDGGEAWRACAPLTDLPSSDDWSYPPRPDTHHVRWIEPDPHERERLYVAVEAGALLRTDDGGETWTDRPEGARRDNHTLATHPDVPGRVYAAAGDGYAQSEDGGDTWAHPQTGLDHRYVWGVAVPRSDPDTVVVSAASGARSAHGVGAAETHVYRTSDAGNPGKTDRSAGETDGTVEWSLAMDGLPDPEGTVRSDLAAGAGETLYALNNHGLYRSDDAGRAWARLGVEWPAEYESRTPHGLVVVRD